MKHIVDYVSAMFNVWDNLERSMRDLVFFVLSQAKELMKALGLNGKTLILTKVLSRYRN